MQDMEPATYCDDYQQDSGAGKVFGVVKALPYRVVYVVEQHCEFYRLPISSA